MDNFYEQLVGTTKTTIYQIANSSVYVLGVVAALCSSFSLIFTLLIAAFAIFIFFFKGNLYVEYEYSFVNGEIDIDKILEMKKRKKACTFHIKDVELLAIEDSAEIKGFSNPPQKVVSYYPENTDKKIYIAMITNGAQRMQLKFVPNEEFLNLCYKYNPKAVKKGI